MNNFKRRISLILSIMMISLTILPIFIVNAADDIAYTVKLNGSTMSTSKVYEVKEGDKLVFTATSSYVDIGLVGYYYDDDFAGIVSEYDNSISFQVPAGEPGSTVKLKVNASGYDADENVVQGKGATYTLKYANEEVANKKIAVKYASKTLANNSVTTVNVGDAIKISATPSAEVVEMNYAWGAEDWKVVSSASATIYVPSFAEGSSNNLYVIAKYSDGQYSDSGKYTFKIAEKVVETPDDPVDDPVQTPTTEVVSMTVKMDSKVIKGGNTYIVKGGEKIVATASSLSGIAFIGYRYNEGKTTDAYSNVLTFILPEMEDGTNVVLYIEAVANSDDGEKNPVKTGWVPFYLKYEVEEENPVVANKAMSVTYAGKVLSVNSTTVANPGESVRIDATPSDKVTKLYFKWDSDVWATVTGSSSYSTKIPTTFAAGSTHTLYVKAAYEDGQEISQQKYVFTIPAAAADITMNVKLDSRTITSGKTYNVEGGEEVEVNASATGVGVKEIKYYFDSEAVKTVSSSTARFNVPTEKAGKTVKLYVEAIANDGTSTGKSVYTLKFIEDSKGELDVEPWMEVNDEIADLAVSLRNDSMEEEKANINIYALGEVVTYYVDYKNGTGDDITNDVTLKLELPLDFDVVDADGGVVDSDEKTITWVFEDGLEEDEEGTKAVEVKYTAFTKSKYDSEKIYPSASIAKGKKEKDRSTVINLIISEYDEEIDIEHEPYMYGDENADTFRPDDSITRAEGALVLARIYGLNYTSTKVTNVFSDLDETYLEAQKAIVAATKAGLISGYTDGTFKPNKEMTKAEFMKILACMVEKQAEEEEIEGLEIKDSEYTIKFYDDATRYYIVDGKKIYSHWALEEVSLLARLNMTPLDEDNTEIELDEEITRAEVAQLVNFYLLRAPAYVTSKTKSGFDDVSKKHELFADIIEATREAHTFSMVEDEGTERAE